MIKKNQPQKGGVKSKHFAKEFTPVISGGKGAGLFAKQAGAAKPPYGTQLSVN
jgi:hypothetical protein